MEYPHRRGISGSCWERFISNSRNQMGTLEAEGFTNCRRKCDSLTAHLPFFHIHPQVEEQLVGGSILLILNASNPQSKTSGLPAFYLAEDK